MIMAAKRIHFIAIGGSAMHNLAIALHLKGYIVTGSDDEIFDPALSRLKQHELLPEAFGWFPEKIDNQIDEIILGMHARADNPELEKARQLGIKIFSYPEYLYEQSKDKLRVVVGGSHGKTTITAMILHVLHHYKVDTDYMVGAKLEGFDVMVRLSHTARVMVIEGDEYLTSPIDLRPKFHLYKPDIALVSGIAWDHVNVFPTFDNYVNQFRIFAGLIPADGALIYCEADDEVNKLAAHVVSGVKLLPYSVPEHRIRAGKTILLAPEGEFALKVFGQHNLMNLEGARNVCNLLGISNLQFYQAIQEFKGATNRLELLTEKSGFTAYRDFAHAPSKLKATIQAVKSQYPERKLVACFELHTYSSLNRDFLSHYEGAMNAADVAVVYFSPHALKLKKLPDLQSEDIINAFGMSQLHVFSSPASLENYLRSFDWNNANLLMMSSGNYDGINVKEFANSLID
jgi:UDP-N-acetylmuramate: L-alanyl-gamma-D-glutamyl-meso-diaminopimelate ligase